MDAGSPPVQAVHGVAPVLGHRRLYRTCIIDGILEHSPAEHVRRPAVPAESPTLGFTHLQFEALLTAARESSHPCDFALVAMLGLLGLRIFEATGADIADLGDEHGHRVLRVCGKGGKVVLVPLPPAVGRAIDRAIGDRASGPVLLNSRGTRMDRHAATRRLRRLAQAAGVPIARPHPHMLRHTFVTTMLDAGVDLRDVQIAARHADPRTTMRYDRARQNLDRHPNYILAAYMAPAPDQQPCEPVGNLLTGGPEGYSREVADLADYLDLPVSQAREQFRSLLARRPVRGGRQVTFLPAETLLCLAASFLVNHRHYGGSTAHRAPEPVPSLARLFSRPPSSVLAKMANLDGSRSHGARWDVLAGAILRDDPARFSATYRLLLHAARTEGIGPARLPDFLGLEHGGELALLGQEELDISVLESELRDQIRQHHDMNALPDLETERILLAAARVGQHVFARQVLANCGSSCVFCGLRPAAFGATRMLLAGHIKPWKDSTPAERLDPRNGLAACPAHDVAFDTGMLTVNGGLRIHLTQQLADAVQADPLARQYYGKPPLREVILLPEGAQAPARKYLDWHHEKIFIT